MAPPHCPSDPALIYTVPEAEPQLIWPCASPGTWEEGAWGAPGACLSLLWLQIQTSWMAYKHQNMISHSSGGWKSKTGVPVRWGEGPLLGCRLLTVPSPSRRGEGVLWNLFYEVLVPLMRAPPSQLKRSQRPELNTNPTGVRIPTSEFWGTHTLRHSKGHFPSASPALWQLPRDSSLCPWVLVKWGPSAHLTLPQADVQNTNPPRCGFMAAGFCESHNHGSLLF